jgi:hypothetical protein
VREVLDGETWEPKELVEQLKQDRRRGRALILGRNSRGTGMIRNVTESVNPDDLSMNRSRRRLRSVDN